jgi:hypothetical protein
MRAATTTASAQWCGELHQAWRRSSGTAVFPNLCRTDPPPSCILCFFHARRVGAKISAMRAGSDCCVGSGRWRRTAKAPSSTPPGTTGRHRRLARRCSRASLVPSCGVVFAKKQTRCTRRGARSWWVVGGPDGYRWAGTRVLGDKRIAFLAETLSKLRFLVLHSPSTLSTFKYI